MVSFLIILASFASAFLFDYLSAFNSIHSIFAYQKESHGILKDNELSDDEKQKILLSSARKIFLATLNLNLFLAVIFLPYILLIFYVGPWFTKYTHYFEVISSGKGIFLSSASFLVYYLIKKENESSGYTLLQRFFHRIALGSKIVPEISFDSEKNIFLKKSKTLPSDDRHLFITGLARSGTTALLNSLYETNQFASLTYSDMPLIMAPNLWKKISFQKSNSAVKERAHKDGIFINSESPEALDEVFWKVASKDNYILEDCLTINTVSHEILDQFEDYIDLILLKNTGKKQLPVRYLSKNNNNVLRIHSLLEKFPNASIVIPFRSPMEHSLSLMNQHRHFSEIQGTNPFSLSYMNWLGHHEFGLNQKPFYFGDERLFDQMNVYPKDDINYWLLNWLNYYSYVLEHFTKSCILFSYEQFCKNPNKVMDKLAKQIDLKNNTFEITPYKQEKRTSKTMDKEIYDACKKVYEELTSKI